MKRFYRIAEAAPAQDGWHILLDGRPVRTQGGAAQIVPSAALGRALADEWNAQGDEIDPRGFILRDLSDFAIDKVQSARSKVIDALLAYAETDTLCYRADPDEPLHQRQREVWEPLVQAAETRHGITLNRISGIMHRPQPAETLARLREVLAQQDDFALAGLTTLAALAASLVAALAVLEDGADIPALFAAANCEEDWQAELWGQDYLAEQDRTIRLAAFTRTADFIALARLSV